MSKKITAIKGMEDLYQADQVRLWQGVESIARRILERAGFCEMRTPIVEDAALFERSVGESTDIVEKEMYTLYDRNEKRLALRPEGTASVVRAFIQNFANHNILEGRFYYLGPMFRYERPQKGRYRQFHQIGAEIFGTDHPLADAEMMALVFQLFSELKLPNITLQLNSLGSATCRQKYREALQTFLAKIQDQFDKKLRERVQRNPLRVLDSKDEKVQTLLEEAPNILDFLSQESRTHLEQVEQALSDQGIAFQLNPRMVRGLDYYEQTVFEFLCGDLGAQNAVAGGGRYNDLVADLGGPKVPAVGFALGMERLVSVLPANFQKDQKAPRVYLVGLDEVSTEALFQKIFPLRESGLVVQLDFETTSLKSKMRRASKWQADWVVILGEQERQKGVWVLRNMQDSSQEEIPMAEALEKLRRVGS